MVEAWFRRLRHGIGIRCHRSHAASTNVNLQTATLCIVSRPLEQPSNELVRHRLSLTTTSRGDPLRDTSKVAIPRRMSPPNGPRSKRRNFARLTNRERRFNRPSANGLCRTCQNGSGAIRDSAGIATRRRPLQPGDRAYLRQANQTYAKRPDAKRSMSVFFGIQVTLRIARIGTPHRRGPLIRFRCLPNEC